MDPKVCGKLLTTHRKGLGDDVEALHGRFPLRRSTGEGSKMGFADTEGYSGGNFVSWCSWMFSGYIGIYRRKKYVRGATRGPRGWGARPPPRARLPTSWLPRLLLDIHSKSPSWHLFQKDCSRRFHPVWTLFDIPFL